MRRAILFCFMIFVAGIYSGCDLESVKIANQEAKNYMEAFKAGDYKAMYQMMDESLKKKAPFSLFETIHRDLLLKTGKIKSYRKTNFFLTIDQPKKGLKHGAVFEVTFEKAQFPYNIFMLTIDGKSSIISWKFKSMKTGKEDEDEGY